MAGRWSESRAAMMVLVLAALSFGSAPAWTQNANEAQALNHEMYRLYQAGRFKEAAEVEECELALRERQVGPNHPEVALALNNLAEMYRTLGRYAEAEPLFKRSLAIRERALGPEHPHVASTLNNLAYMYAIQGRYADAEPL
jgi:tetratricopeptide (TPR) repeat protein